MLKQVFSFLVCLLLVSCSYFEKINNREAIPEVDTIVDFSKVDAFPLFLNCNDIPSREKQQVCFQLEMANHIYAALKSYSLSTTEILNDTILVKLKVDAAGFTSLSEIQISEETRTLLPQFDSLIKVSLQKLPKLEPAIKRNMPVTTEFTLPIILKN